MVTRPRRYVSIPAYTLVVLLLVAVISPLGAFFASVKVAENNARQNQVARDKALAASQEQARLVACGFFAASLDVTDETPPSTAAGIKQREKYLELYNITGCKPPRAK
jgi:hypothetical protein